MEAKGCTCSDVPKTSSRSQEEREPREEKKTEGRASPKTAKMKVKGKVAPDVCDQKAPIDL